MSINVQSANLKIYRYSNYSHTFNLFTDEDSTQPVIISGYTAKLQFRDKPGGTLLFSATNADYLTVLQSQLKLEIPTNIVGAWTFNACLYDAFVISTTNKPTPVVRGSVQVYPAITQI